MNNRTDIVFRNSSVNVRSIDIENNITNPWRWEWLDKQVNGTYLQECIRKLIKPGVAYCIVCSQELFYKSRGCVALTDHVRSNKHKTALELRNDTYSLPETGECSKKDTTLPYGLHPRYAVLSPAAEVTIPQPSVPLSDRISNNEAMLLSFIAEKSLPFSIAPDLIELTKELSRDRKALDRMSMHRTAAAYKLRFGVAQTFKDKLISDLQSTYFSLNLDESMSNNHKKIVTVLVNYLGDEKKIVTKHLESFSLDTLNSNSIFESVKDLFQKNDLPWNNLMSILLDSCNVMRGKKGGLETKMREHCPHLLDIDGDSCHHAHNAAKAFCKPFSKYLENLIIDVHNDLKYSPDLRAIFSLICEALNIKYTMPQNFISFRWLSIYDSAQDLSRLFNALIIFYFSFLSSSKRVEFLHVLIKIFKQHEVSEEGKNKIRNLQASLQKKCMTEAGKERKFRIASKLFENQLKTKLILSLFLSVLPLLQEYVKLFQTASPSIHLIYDKQITLLKNFMACFVKPEVITAVNNSPKKIKQLRVDESTNHLPKKCIFIGDLAKKLISIAPKSSVTVVKEFYQNTLQAYISCAKVLQSKMPVTNRFLKAASTIDPALRQHSYSLQLMKELPDHVTNIINSDEREAYELEVQKYHIDSIRRPNDSEDIDAWWIDIQISQKYPLLSKMALALLTCFHGPKVESSFSAMNNIITPESSRMNVSTFSAIQSVKYELSAKKTSSVALFRKKDFLKDPVDRNLCKNIRTSCKRYTEEKLENKIAKEIRINDLNNKKQKVLSKVAAKKICAKAAEEQRKKHLKNNLKKNSKSKSVTKSKVTDDVKNESPSNSRQVKAYPKEKMCSEDHVAEQECKNQNETCKPLSDKEVINLKNPEALHHLKDNASKPEVVVTTVRSTSTVVKCKITESHKKCGPPSKRRKTDSSKQPSIKELFARSMTKK